jgi:hypothetical protein
MSAAAAPSSQTFLIPETRCITFTPRHEVDFLIYIIDFFTPFIAPFLGRIACICYSSNFGRYSYTAIVASAS